MRFSYIHLGLTALAFVSAVPSQQNTASISSHARRSPRERTGPLDLRLSRTKRSKDQQKVILPTYAGGEAVYFLQQKQYGSCMEIHEDEDHVVAISYKLQGSYLPPPYCGREIEISNVGGGKENNDVGSKIRARVVDTCTVCDTADLELSVGAFQALKGGDLDPFGNFTVDWRFV